MPITQKPFCLMPWTHVHITNKGKVNACCVAPITYGDINKQSLEDIWKGESIEKIREQFSEGKGDKRCNNCISKEASGASSMRLETFEKFPDFDITESKGPIYFDIRFSNVCNFKCRTCWHGASSKWFEDAKILGTNLGEKAIIKNIDDFEAFMSENGKHLLNSQEIYFAGGEPLVTEEHYLLLEFLIENNVKPRLRYNTNLSLLKFKKYDVLELWSKFTDVEVMASIDGVGKQGEYIRSGLNWNQFEKNCLILQKYPFINLKISPTISILNMNHVEELINTCLEKKLVGMDDFYFNILDRPFYYNVQAIPLPYKKKITDNLIQFKNENTNFSQELKNGIESIVNYMNHHALDEKYWRQYQQKNTELDKIREESDVTSYLG
jgi:MoaA/NifB/PqqE/SkfB family radical SAM enzyme